VDRITRWSFESTTFLSSFIDNSSSVRTSVVLIVMVMSAIMMTMMDIIADEVNAFHSPTSKQVKRLLKLSKEVRDVPGSLVVLLFR